MFHVPERARITTGSMATDPGIPAGGFQLDSCEPGWDLIVIADDGRCPGEATGWEHVSVRALRGSKSRVPTWREMCQIKALFWHADAVVMQLHPAVSNYINQHPHVLHLWRPIDAAIPVPPTRLV